jgi:hypothetical protein
MARNKKIESWDDERSIGNSLIVALKPGFAFAANGSDAAEHVYGFDTVREANAGVRDAAPCDCDICTGKARS